MNDNIDKKPTSPRKIGASRAKKEAIVAELSEKASKAKAMVFTNYTGMTHVQLEQLKKSLKTADAELVVAKNTLLSLALKQSQNLEGPTGTIFAYGDVINPLKELAKTIRTLKLPLIKFGLAKRDPAPQDIGSYNWQLLAEGDIVRLSTLPSREVLLAQLVGGLKSPIYDLHRALSWSLQKLVMTLSAVQQKKV